MEDINHFCSGEIYNGSNFMVFLNGQVVGVIPKPDEFVKTLRFMRRKGHIGEKSEFISISINKDKRAVNIDSDEGRLCRPLIVV